MIYTVSGTLEGLGKGFAIVTCGGIGLKVTMGSRTLSALPPVGSVVQLFCYLYIRDERFELYAFSDEASRTLFELLNTVTGVGPKTALGVLDIDTPPNIVAAILERRADVLTHTSGIGRKTADRIILELHSKMELPSAKAHALTGEIDLNRDVEEVLVGLGYHRQRVRDLLSQIKPAEPTVEGRLKQALRELGRPR